VRVRIILIIALVVLLISPVKALNVSLSKYFTVNFQANTVGISGRTAIYGGNQLVALNDSGILWKKNIPVKMMDVSGDYIAIANGNKVSLLILNGTILWSRDVENPVSAISVTKYGNVSVGTVSGDIYLFNKTGGLVWKYKLKIGVQSVSSIKNFIAVSDFRGRIYYFEKFGKFPWRYTCNTLLNWIYKTGWCIWEYDGISNLCTYPEVYLKVTNNGVFVISKFMRYAYLFSRDGYLLWNKSFSDKPISFDGNGKIFVIGFNNGKVCAFNREGKLLWNVNFRNPAIVSVSINYTAVGSNKLLALLSNEGKVLWFSNTPEKIEKLAISNSAIAVCDDNIYYYVPNVLVKKQKSELNTTISNKSIKNKTKNKMIKNSIKKSIKKVPNNLSKNSSKKIESKVKKITEKNTSTKKGLFDLKSLIMIAGLAGAGGVSVILLKRRASNTKRTSNTKKGVKRKSKAKKKVKKS